MSQKNQKNGGFLLILAVVAAAAASLAIDVPVAQAFRAWNQSPTVASWLGYFNTFEMFGHGFGVFVLVVALHQLDPGRRWAIPRVVLCAMAAGGLANVVKMLIQRTRPYECALDGTVWDTFGAWLPILNAGSPGQSLPSAHTATAVGFAIALIWLYPQGRWLFWTLAVLVACQRVVCGAHYVSDVWIGAAVGFVIGQVFFQIGLLPGWMDRFEQRLRQSGVGGNATEGS